MFLERSGLRIESVLDAALAKDGGCTPANLAWLLSEMRIPDEVALPASVPPAELRTYVDDLIVRPAPRGAAYSRLICGSIAVGRLVSSFVRARSAGARPSFHHHCFHRPCAASRSRLGRSCR